MGLEADDILMEIKDENIPNEENGKDEKKMEKKDNGVELLTKGKDDSEKTKEKENNKNENFDLQVCDKPSCTNTANKKCSRCFFNTIINITMYYHYHHHHHHHYLQHDQQCTKGVAWSTTALSSA